MRGRVEISLSTIKYNANIIREKIYENCFCDFAEKVEKSDAKNVEKTKAKIDEKEKRNKVQIWWVVKADAYGHGISEVVKAVGDSDGFCVATVEEGVKVRRETISPVLILGKVDGEEVETCIEKDLSMTVDAVDDLDMIVSTSAYMRKIASIHIVVNTGMNRIGINDKKLLYKLINHIKNNKNIRLDGVFSHLSAVEDGVKTERQKVLFEEFSSEMGNGVIRHLGASGSIDAKNLYFDGVRIGASLYGYGVEGVCSCMAIYGRVVAINLIKKGESVGYGSGYMAYDNECVATLSLGYADGVSRSRRGGFVLIGGKRREIIGNVCMDFCFAKVDESVKVGDEVVFMGKQGDAVITAYDIAGWENTIFYEILTKNKRIERVFIE